MAGCNGSPALRCRLFKSVLRRVADWTTPIIRQLFKRYFLNRFIILITTHGTSPNHNYLLSFFIGLYHRLLVKSMLIIVACNVPSILRLGAPHRLSFPLLPFFPFRDGHVHCRHSRGRYTGTPTRKQEPSTRPLLFSTISRTRASRSRLWRIRDECRRTMIRPG
jgi:hypothetical protein